MLAILCIYDVMVMYFVCPSATAVRPALVYFGPRQITMVLLCTTAAVPMPDLRSSWRAGAHGVNRVLIQIVCIHRSCDTGVYSRCRRSLWPVCHAPCLRHAWEALHAAACHRTAAAASYATDRGSAGNRSTDQVAGSIRPVPEPSVYSVRGDWSLSREAGLRHAKVPPSCMPACPLVIYSLSPPPRQRTRAACSLCCVCEGVQVSAPDVVCLTEHVLQAAVHDPDRCN